MGDLSTALNREEVAEIAGRDDFHIAPFRPDGRTFGTPTWIWAVAVDNALFVRAYNGTRSRWYQAAMEQGGGMIQAAGLAKKVRFKSIEGGLQDRIDAAYRAKYRGSPYLNAMISPRARAATVQILPGA